MVVHDNENPIKKGKSLFLISSNYKISISHSLTLSVSRPMHQKKRLGMLRQKRNTSLLKRSPRFM